MLMLPKTIGIAKVPPIKIQGIKTKLVNFISESIEWDGKGTYWEPFMGSGVVGFNLAPSNAVFTDTNPHIINFYNALKNKEFNAQSVREYLEVEGAKLAATTEDKNSYYYKVRDRFNKEHSPLDFLFLQRSNFNGMIRFNKSGQYNVPFGRKPERFQKALVTKIVNQTIWVENLLDAHPDWKFELKSYKDIFSEVKSNDFIYMDPPYIGRHDNYFDSWSDEHATELAKLALESDAGYALSMWHSNKYRNNEHLDEWRDGIILTKEHFYHVGASEKNRQSVTEALVVKKNYINKDIIKKNEQLRMKLF